jgi:putative inorganic carbon (HCO3(-)) transporter
MLSLTKGVQPNEVIFAVLVIFATAALLLAPLPIAALGAVAFVILTSRVPLPALCLIVFSLPFYLLDRHFGRLEFSPTEILIVLTTVAVLLRGAWTLVTRGGYTPQPPLRRRLRGGQGGEAGIRAWVGDPVIAGLVVLLVLTGAASLTASVAIHESLRSFRTIIVEPAVFYFLVVTQVRDRRRLYALVLALVLAGVVISVVGFWQYAMDQRIITAEESLRRIRGFYGSPNNLGLFLGRALPMAVALSLWWKQGRVFWLVASLIMAAALLLTFSIGAWVAVAGSMLVIAALRGRMALRTALGVAVVGLVVAGVAALRIPRIGDHFDLRAGTSLERLLVWQSALRMLSGHAIRGIGLDNFLYYYQHGYRLPAAWREPDLSHPHNLVLDFWLSLGLPGLLLLGLLLGRFVEVVVSVWRESDAMERGICAGALGAMTDTVLHGLVDNSFFLVDLSVLFWLMFAIVAVVRRTASHEA